MPKTPFPRAPVNTSFDVERVKGMYDVWMARIQGFTEAKCREMDDMLDTVKRLQAEQCQDCSALIKNLGAAKKLLCGARKAAERPDAPVVKQHRQLQTLAESALTKHRNDKHAGSVSAASVTIMMRILASAGAQTGPCVHNM
jgi:hypothetical protein